MSDIPRDVIDAARNVTFTSYEDRVRAIARAILKERERCARIAEELESALKELVYEVTHLSAERDDGGHDCTISGFALSKARDAIRASADK